MSGFQKLSYVVFLFVGTIMVARYSMCMITDSIIIFGFLSVGGHTICIKN